MNNLTQTQQSAKQAYLDRQSDQMIATYQAADKCEKNAIIRQIDSFLDALSRDEKTFWLMFWRKLERIDGENHF